MMEQGVRRVLRQVRNISRGLAQAQIEPSRLSTALEELMSRLSETSGVRCLFESAGNVPIGDSLRATHLFHIAQEACTNAIKHARARNVTVLLHATGDSVILQIRDDGSGIAADAREGLRTADHAQPGQCDWRAADHRTRETQRHRGNLYSQAGAFA